MSVMELELVERVVHGIGPYVIDDTYRHAFDRVSAILRCLSYVKLVKREEMSLMPFVAFENPERALRAVEGCVDRYTEFDVDGFRALPGYDDMVTAIKRYSALWDGLKGLSINGLVSSWLEIGGYLDWDSEHGELALLGPFDEDDGSAEFWELPPDLAKFGIGASSEVDAFFVFSTVLRRKYLDGSSDMSFMYDFLSRYGRMLRGPLSGYRLSGQGMVRNPLRRITELSDEDGLEVLYAMSDASFFDAQRLFGIGGFRNKRKAHIDEIVLLDMLLRDDAVDDAHAGDPQQGHLTSRSSVDGLCRMRENTAFDVEFFDGPAHVGLALPVDDIGIPSIGPVPDGEPMEILSCINCGAFHSIVTPRMVEDNLVCFIPDTFTLDLMSRFPSLEAATYKTMFVHEPYAQEINLADAVDVTLAEARGVLSGEMSMSDFLKVLDLDEQQDGAEDA